MLSDEEFKKAEPLLGREKTQQLYLYAKKSPERARRVELYFAKLLSGALGSDYLDRKPLFQPPPPETARGALTLGTVVYGDAELHPFGLDLEELTRHVGIWGSSGSGKSNIRNLVCRELARNEIPFLLMDWKATARDLISTDWCRDAVVFTVGRKVSPFYFNPLQVPPGGTSPDTWLRFVIQELGSAFYTGFGVGDLLARAFKDGYRRYGVYEAFNRGVQPERWPTFVDAYHWLQAQDFRGRRALWADSASRCLYILTEPELRDIVNVTKPVPLERLLEKNVILEMETLPGSDKKFLCGMILRYIEAYDLYNRVTRLGPLRSVIIIEESQNILRRTSGAEEEPETERMFRQARESGRGLIALAQNPSLIPIPVLGNCGTQIAMNLKHDSDLNTCRATMLLSTEQKEQLGRLRIGYGVVRMERFPEPFLVKFPFCPVSVVTDADLMARYGSVPEPERTPELTVEAVETEVVPRDKPGDKGNHHLEKQEPVPGKLAARMNGLMATFLRDVLKHGGDAYRMRLKRLLWAASTGDLVRRRLVALGHLTETKEPGPRGILRMDVTEAGLQWLGDQATESSGTRRFGGPQTKAVLQQLKQRYEAEGWKVTLEAPLPEGTGHRGRRVDMVLEKPGHRIAVELESGEAREGMIRNIRKCLDAGVFDEVWSVAANQTVAERIRRDCHLASIQNSRLRLMTQEEAGEQLLRWPPQAT